MEKVLQRLKRKLTIENLWLYIIKILIDEGKPVRAYTFKKELKEKYGINPSTVTVYMVVYKLVSEGLIEKVSVGSETMYKPTSKGIGAYHEGLEMLKETLMKLSA